MKIFSLLFLFALVSCQDYNSNSSDREKFGTSNLTGSAEFKAAYPILVKRCANCHSSNIHAVWASYEDEQDWIKNNLIVAGDSRNSDIIIRTINTGGALSDMPREGSALPDDEYNKLLTWIDSL